MRSGVTSTASWRRRADVDDIWAERARGNAAQRYGDPTELGAACAFLCSAQAGYVTGQNLLIDGGGYPPARY